MRGAVFSPPKAIATIAAVQSWQFAHSCGISARLIVAKNDLQPIHCAEQLKALGEPLRLRIVSTLRTGPKNVGDLAEILGVEMVTVSHHLGILRSARLVKTERQGRFIVYSLREGVFRPADSARGSEHIDLGCCRLEIPKE